MKIWDNCSICQTRNRPINKTENKKVINQEPPINDNHESDGDDSHVNSIQEETESLKEKTTEAGPWKFCRQYD